MYVDAFLDKTTDIIHVAERHDNQRHLRNLPASYVFYYEDDHGVHRSMFGHHCKRYANPHRHQFHIALKKWRTDGRRIFESDTNPIFRALTATYAGVDAPVLHLGFFDIEAGFDKERGFAPPDDPFNPITAISLYRSADQRLLSFVLKPPTLTWEAAQAIAAATPDTKLYDDEKAMLLDFLAEIEDVDVLTGWNSSSYDVPYLVNRIRRLLSIDATRKFCLWEQLPSPRQYKNKFGRLVDTYDLIGRVHLDYLDLYAKHTPQQRLSYALNAIAELEIGETKVAYEGTLDDLYLKDFDKFILYNRQDVMLMVKIDRKLKFIELANQIAHANGVLLKTTMGSVALVEAAIINEMHAMDFVVPDRSSETDPDEDLSEITELDDEDETVVPVAEGRTPVVGAYVAQPKIGLQDHVGCVDIKSLYPSAIRALNMSPETLFGQVRLDETMRLVNERVAKLTKTQRAEAWDGLFCTCEVQHMHDQDDIVVTVDFFNHLDGTTTTIEMTGKALHEFIFDPNNHVCISANGTIFRTDVEGIIPALLAKWYAQRESMQAKQHEYEKLRDTAITDTERTEAAAQSMFWDQRQKSRKILLNSLYGTLLNEHFRLFDERLGQSTTLTGRSIDRHMNARINEIITGTYDYRGDALIYADTDSAFFSAYHALKDHPDYRHIDWTPETVIKLYDWIAEETNKTFAGFMDHTFHTGLERGGIISAGRELVGHGLFIKKKKYAILMYDKEGKRLDVDGEPGQLKVMGLDLKRADTPKVMQQFLKKLLLDLLTGVSREQMYEDIKQFRITFKTRPGWEKGSPKKVANLSEFAAKDTQSNQRGLSLTTKIGRQEKLRVNMPGHVRASLNWNLLCDLHEDRHATRITDSNRIIVCKLTNNPMRMTSIAYPMDEHLPSWFKEMPFDEEAMEETIIDAKIMNLVGVLDWNLIDTKVRAASDLFSWS